MSRWWYTRAIGHAPKALSGTAAMAAASSRWTHLARCCTPCRRTGHEETLLDCYKLLCQRRERRGRVNCPCAQLVGDLQDALTGSICHVEVRLAAIGWRQQVRLGRRWRLGLTYSLLLLLLSKLWC